MRPGSIEHTTGLTTNVTAYGPKSYTSHARQEERNTKMNQESEALPRKKTETFENMKSTDIRGSRNYAY